MNNQVGGLNAPEVASHIPRMSRKDAWTVHTACTSALQPAMAWHGGHAMIIMA